MKIIRLILRLPAPTHKFKVGDKVIFTNIFGVCWGVKTITSLEWEPKITEDRPDKPAYHYEGTDTPWFPCAERFLTKATRQDLKSTPQQLQDKYGFTPVDYCGCY